MAGALAFAAAEEGIPLDCLAPEAGRAYACGSRRT